MGVTGGGGSAYGDTGTHLGDEICQRWELLGGNEPSAPHLRDGQASPVPRSITLEEDERARTEQKQVRAQIAHRENTHR